jgi:integration host factor subunit beta
MTRSELVDRLHSRVPTLTHDDAKSVVDVILEAITRSVVADSRVEIRGFGSFSLSYRQPRVGRNPKSGEKVQVPGKVRSLFQGWKRDAGGRGRPMMRSWG